MEGDQARSRKQVDLEDHHDDVKEEFDDNNQSPFQIQVIMGALMKLVSTEELITFRLVSTLWNVVGAQELAKRSKNSIKFETIEELEDDDKLGELIRLQKSHQEIFPIDQNYFQQLFSDFSFFVKTLTSPRIDVLLEQFTPKCVQFYGDLNEALSDYPTTAAGLAKAREALEIEFPFSIMSKSLCKFLVKISSFVEEIDYTNFHFSFANKWKKVDEEIIQELTCTKFPKLTGIANDITSDNLMKMFFFPIIGQNSPKLKFLDLGPMLEKYRPLQDIKEKFESTGLMAKLKTLKIIDVRGVILEILTGFGRRGLLKLATIIYKDYEEKKVKRIFAQFLASQAGSLKLLNISEAFSQDIKPPPGSPPKDLIPFPSLPNLIFLYIDYFSSFEPYYHPIDFTRQLPKLINFQTRDMETFLDEDLGQGVGACVKSVTIIRGRQKYEPDSGDAEIVDYEKLHEIFPNLEFLSIHHDLMPTDEYQNLQLWSQLEKVTIYCQLSDLRNFDDHEFLKEDQGNFKDIKKVEIVVNCGTKLMGEDLYWKYLAANCKRNIFDHYTRIKSYKKYFDYVYESLSPIRSLSFKFDGYMISEGFKRDFRATFPGRDCVFICSSLNNYLPSIEDLED